MALPQGLPEHLRNALARGESVLFEGEHLMPDQVGTREQLMTSETNLKELLEAKDAEIKTLESRVIEIQESPAGQVDGELFKALLPSSPTEMKQASKGTVALLAKHTGVSPEGKEDEAFRLEILAKLKEMK